MPIVTVTQEAEVGGSPKPRKVEAAVSHDCVPVLQPEQQSKTLSQKTNKQKRKQEGYNGLWGLREEGWGKDEGLKIIYWVHRTLLG